MTLLQDTREACLAVCAQACDGCIVRPDMSECFRASLECAEICQCCDEAVGSFRRAQLPPASLDLWCRYCAAICESCAADCERFDRELYQHCADLCRRAAAECRSLAAEVSRPTRLK